MTYQPSMNRWIRALVAPAGPAHFELSAAKAVGLRRLDRSELARVIDGKGWQAALPSAFPDDMLVRLVCTFRDAEHAVLHQRTGAFHSIGAATYLVRTLLLQHPNWNGDWQLRGSDPEAGERALKVYQQELEQELVSRITGFKATQEAEALVNSLWAALDCESRPSSTRPEQASERATGCYRN